MQIEEIKLLDVKDKLIVIKSDQINADSIKSIRKSLFEKGCLGVIALGSDSDISSLGLKELEDIVEQIKNRTDYKKT